LSAGRAAYRERRDLLVGGLNELGLTCALPAGAFYAFPDVTRISNDSREASEILLNRAQVATVPDQCLVPTAKDTFASLSRLRFETIEAGWNPCGETCDRSAKS
jgi:aspartate aminotransferase